MYRPFAQLSVPGGITSVIGSGGKTTLLSHLAGQLRGRVILTTSTHIYPFPGVPLIDTAVCGPEDVRDSLARSRVVCVGRRTPSGKLSSPAGEVPFEALLSLADYILVEADGSAGLPLKAHRSFEPVIPAASRATVCVVGASGIGKPLRQVCHCPELFASLAGMDPEETVKIEHIAGVLRRENLADCYYVSQTDLLEDPKEAYRLCCLIHKDAYARL